jgi:hypothetical protein
MRSAKMNHVPSRELGDGYSMLSDKWLVERATHGRQETVAALLTAIGRRRCAECLSRYLPNNGEF